jgi:hypothetical protein
VMALNERVKRQQFVWNLVSLTIERARVAQRCNGMNIVSAERTYLERLCCARNQRFQAPCCVPSNTKLGSTNISKNARLSKDNEDAAR